LFDRYQAGEQGILVHVDFPDESSREDLAEFKMLASSAGVATLDVATGKRNTPHPKYFVGSGKASEIADMVRLHNANIILFNHSLSPSQEKHIEALCECRVVDRTTLILDIFAQRARTHEGKMQVELAQLKHLSSRLIRGWTHLERQKGGIGLRGPGETQLETDRRLLRERISNILKRLKKVERQRQQGRRLRTRAEIPTISLVGYTNAGKSTLFNCITNADVYIADQLFATLDPTSRKVKLPGGRTIVLTDTVGFIRKLPHRLIDAFKATLEEALVANLLLHVIDFSCSEFEEHLNTTNEVLEELGAEDKEILTVYNKIDQGDQVMTRLKAKALTPDCIFVSCKTGEGIQELLQIIEERLNKSVVSTKYSIPHQRYDLVAKLREQGCISTEEVTDCGTNIEATPRGKLVSLLEGFLT